ncbi:DUF2254 domain-containing protein [Paraburkholderia sp. Tr-20389]|uniref:DUF2254 domain-containing protein n=1 Tax=Paraburkholderia sp. Tr-20389 TaxID=2703903 RepID=UPI0019803C22|nr:DUF2254 domain-containing protein [Paraburkholderia sp. Tr-20389]MBN3752213.1 DUF2254 domain-containing protein [Paraburkholderia sp. Tr-20389]
MAWNRRYSVISYVRSSLWIVPILAVIAGIVLKRIAEYVGAWLTTYHAYDLQHGFLAVNADEAHSILDRIFTLNLSCLVFSFGSLLVAIQVAGGQYTPRIIATTLLRDNVIRWIVGLFVFSLLWTHRTMAELGQSVVVPQLQVFLATIIGLASLVAFILLIDYSARLLRPVSLIGRVADQGFAVIRHIYPYAFDEARRQWVSGSQKIERAAIQESASAANGDRASKGGAKSRRVVAYRGRSGVVLAANLHGLAREAQRLDCLIEFAVQVGDFIATDEPLFYLHGGSVAVRETDDRRLQSLVALGSERTMEQDPMFAFRIEVDIALKALSAAINDPTTAVLAIDQLHRLLRVVGKRSLADRTVRDDRGQARVLFRTPQWRDYVHISIREIRQCGAGSMQIDRRLRAMIENLMKTLPVSRHEALLRELELLDAAIVREHMFDEDRALARIPDTQGLGGASEMTSGIDNEHAKTSDVGSIDE